MCPVWNTSGNSCSNYGNVIGYPPHRLQVKCHQGSAGLQANSVYSCLDEPGSSKVVISNFWSTTGVDQATNMPLAALLLDALVFDLINQTVSMGKFRLLLPLDIAVVNLCCDAPQHAMSWAAVYDRHLAQLAQGCVLNPRVCSASASDVHHDPTSAFLHPCQLRHCKNYKVMGIVSSFNA